MKEPKFKAGDRICNKSGNLGATITSVNPPVYWIEFDFHMTNNHSQPGTIEVFDRDYMNEKVFNSKLYKALK